MGLGFIGVVKEASCKCTMANMQSKCFNGRGIFYGLLSEEVNEGVPEIILFAWVYRDRRYVITERESIN